MLLTLVTSPGTLNEVNEIDGLFYTVQVGAYSKEVTDGTLNNITPLNADRAQDGIIRYTSGVYSSVPSASAAKDVIVQKGVSDAFVTAYYNGRRITVAEARNLVNQNGNNILAISGGGAPTTPSQPSTPPANVEYKVLIGSYASDVPLSDAAIILDLGNVEKVKENGKTSYYVGGFQSQSEAEALQSRLSGLGKTDTVLKAYQDGNEIDL